MRVAVDANILVRVLVHDDHEQTAEAEALLDSADALVVSMIVLCEVAWVLRRVYRFGSPELHAGLTALTAPNKVEVNRPVLRAGLEMLARGGDFADGCILEEARAARCKALATFDKDLISRGRPLAAHPAQIE